MMQTKLTNVAHHTVMISLARFNQEPPADT
jgi:hypothetical protein